MRCASLVPALALLLLSTAASAQSWEEYVNRENFFTINLPGTPAVTQTSYRSAGGATLNARVFTASAPAGSILSGTYTVTVVDYGNAKNDIPTALEQAAIAIKAKGTTKYDGLNYLDLHVTRRLTVETPTTRILAEILFAANNRLYITQAQTALNVPPPANFQASLQILDEAGVRIRTRTLLGIAAGQDPKLGAGGVANESDKMAGLIAGAWRVAGGACDSAFFKSGTRVKTGRGEEAMTGTIVNSGMTFPVHAIINGAREAQIINPTTDRVIMLFEPRDDGRLNISSIGPPALGWPDVTLELCPGSRG